MTDTRTMRAVQRRDDPGHRRYVLRNGVLVVRKNRNGAAWIPDHTPHISVVVSRDTAAQGLRMARAGEA